MNGMNNRGWSYTKFKDYIKSVHNHSKTWSEDDFVEAYNTIDDHVVEFHLNSEQLDNHIASIYDDDYKF